MKAEILEALIAARREKRTALLYTDLDSGAQTLITAAAPPLGDLPVSAEMMARGATVLRSDRGVTEEEGDHRVFIQPFNPPLRLILVGAVHISQALAPMAALAGYDVTVVDPRQAFATDARFPGIAVSRDWPDEAVAALAPDTRTAIVTLTHDPKLDDPALDTALKSPAFYIAALGSRKTHAARRERLAELGHDDDTFARIHGPAGLPLGAATPAEIAIAVMAQMTQALRQAA